MDRLELWVIYGNRCKKFPDKRNIHKKQQNNNGKTRKHYAYKQTVFIQQFRSLHRAVRHQAHSQIVRDDKRYEWDCKYQFDSVANQEYAHKERKETCIIEHANQKLIL